MKKDGKFMRLAIIHTTASTITSLKEKFGNSITGLEIVNILDDSILPDLRQSHDVDFVRRRWIEYARIAQEMGVDAVLSACSSVGAFADEADGLLSVPVLRIDEPMARQAVSGGKDILVLATLDSTLTPTTELLGRCAAKSGRDCNIKALVVDGAFSSLSAGDKGTHDRLIRNVVLDEADKADVIVFAQASMASAVSDLSSDIKNKVLTSPDCFVQWFKDVFMKKG